jgi:hypothetical protein
MRALFEPHLNATSSASAVNDKCKQASILIAAEKREDRERIAPWVLKSLEKLVKTLKEL